MELQRQSKAVSDQKDVSNQSERKVNEEMKCQTVYLAISQKESKMNRVTCWMCEHGPAAGMKKKKCEWSGDIRGQGSMACKEHFASSVASGLRCYDCKGPLSLVEAMGDEPLCSSCREKRLAKQERFEKRWVTIGGFVLGAGLLFLVIGYLVNHG